MVPTSTPKLHPGSATISGGRATQEVHDGKSGSHTTKGHDIKENGVHRKLKKIKYSSTIQVEVEGSTTATMRYVKSSMTAVADDIQAASLPDPIPDDDIPPSSTLERTTLIIPPTFSLPTSAAIAVTSTQGLTESTSYVRSTTTVWVYATTSAATSPLSIITPDTSQSSPSHLPVHLPVYIIALVTAGATGLALVLFLALRFFIRRDRRAGFPTPSNPILQDSPLFGGKERFSRSLWSQTDPSFGNLFHASNRIAKGDGWRPLSGNKYVDTGKTHVNEKRLSTFTATSFPAGKFTPAPLSPASVYTTAAPATNIGIALDFPLPVNTTVASTQPLNVKTKSGGKAVRRQSVTTSMYGGLDSNAPIYTDSGTEMAYQDPRPAPTPGGSKAALKPAGPSREQGQGPRRKNVPQGQRQIGRRASRGGKEKDEPFMYALPMVKSDERRDRDTRALTSALGLASPPPPSSCFSPVSIYPDDSLSVAHGHGGGRRVSIMLPPSEIPSPTTTHAALGSFMLQDFPSTATIASLRGAGDPFAGAPPKKNQTRNISDKPPRVPSPPPLPSLAQMAMAHADPDYRSPTYSIYGLYEAQRKSKASYGGN